MTRLPTTPPRGTDSPYPGLRPYLRDEADLFFGRDEQVAQVLGRLHEARFLAVVGTSGCGKSSLVYAGIIPALETYLEVTDGSNLMVVALRPGDQPLRALARALLKGLDPARAAAEDAVAFLRADLCRGPLALVEVLRTSAPPEGTHLLFLIDQFEEIFRYREEQDSDEADAFVALLLATAQRTDVAAHVILTMRSDYLGDCAVFAGLPEAISASQFLTPRMTRDQRKRAIEGPALAAGGRLEADLVNRLLNDMDSGSDQLPLMQHVLMRLWLKARAAVGDDAAGIELKLKDYEGADIGGLAHALDLHADEAYASLETGRKPDPRRIAEVMFRLLSERDAGTHNEGRPRDARRPTPLQTVVDVAGAGVTPADVAGVVEGFRAPGLNFLTPPVPEPLEPATRLDVSHESLIRRWRRLQGWIEAEAKSAEIYRRLVDRARLWRAGDANLLRRIETNAALAWRDRERPNASWAGRYGGDFELAMRFLDESDNDCRREEIVQERRRNARVVQARWIAAVSAVGLIATLVLAGWALKEREHAQEETASAMRARDDELTAKKTLSDNNVKLNETNARLRKSDDRARALVRSFSLTDKAKGALDKFPQLAVLLAMEALRAASIDSDQTTAESSSSLEALKQALGSGEEALRLSLRDISGRGFGGQDRPINHIAATADGRRVVTASPREILFWDLPDGGGIPRATPLLGPTIGLNYLAIPPGDRWIVARDLANTIFLWRLKAARPVAENAVSLPDPSPLLYPSFDGRWLLTSGQKRTADGVSGGRPPASLCDLGTDDLSPRDVDLQFGKDSRTVLGFTFDPGGKWLATVQQGMAVTCWDLSATGTDFRPVKLPCGPGSFTNVIISRDGRRLIVSLQDGKARVWELEHPGREPVDVPLHGPGETASTLTTDEHGRWAVTSAHPPPLPAGAVAPAIPTPPIVRLWDLFDPAIGKHPVELGMTESARPLSLYNRPIVSGDRKWLASSTNIGLILWRLDPDQVKAIQPIRPFANEPSATLNVSTVAFSGDDRRLLVGGFDGVIHSLELATYHPFYGFHNPLNLRGQQGQVVSLVVSRDGRRLLTGGTDGTARSWDLGALSASADPVELRIPHEANTPTSRDPHRRLFAGGDGSVRFWDLTIEDPREEPALVLPPQPTLPHLNCDPDDHWLMARAEGSPTRLWDLSAPGQGPRVVDLGVSEQLSPFLISEDRHWMAASVWKSNPGKVSQWAARIWDLTRDGPPSPPIVVPDEQDVVAFVGRGRRLLTRRDGLYSLWDLKAGLPPSGPTALAGQQPRSPADPRQVTRDGRRLLVLRSRGDASMWDLEDPAAKPVILSRSKTLIMRSFGQLFLTPDGRWAVAFGKDRRASLWKLDGAGPALEPVEPPDPEGPEEREGSTAPGSKGTTEPVIVRPKAIVGFVSSDGRWLIDARKGGEVRLWDLIRPEPFGSPALTFPDRSWLPLLPVSPITADSRWLVTADGNELHIRSLRGKQPTLTAKILLDSRAQFRSLTLDFHGRWAALVGSDNLLRIWELNLSGSVDRAVLQTAGQPSWNGLFLSPGGKWVAAFDGDPVARIFRVPIDDLREAARRAVGRNLTRVEWNQIFPGQDYHKTFDSLPEPPP